MSHEDEENIRLVSIETGCVQGEVKRLVDSRLTDSDEFRKLYNELVQRKQDLDSTLLSTYGYQSAIVIAIFRLASYLLQIDFNMQIDLKIMKHIINKYAKKIITYAKFVNYREFCRNHKPDTEINPKIIFGGKRRRHHKKIIQSMMIIIVPTTNQISIISFKSSLKSELELFWFGFRNWETLVFCWFRFRFNYENQFSLFFRYVAIWLLKLYYETHGFSMCCIRFYRF